jgi:hypothetical protein
MLGPTIVAERSGRSLEPRVYKLTLQRHNSKSIRGPGEKAHAPQTAASLNAQSKHAQVSASCSMPVSGDPKPETCTRWN